MAAHPTVTVYSLVVVYVLLALTLWIITMTDTINLERRSKIESSRTKFHGQLLAALQTELEISTIFESNSVLKQLMPGGLRVYPLRKVLNFRSSEMAFLAFLG